MSLRVLQIGKYYSPHKGGMETYLQTLCERIASKVDLTVLVANDGPDSLETDVNGVRVSRLGTVFKIAEAPVFLGLARRIRRINPGLVHIHVPNPCAVLAYLASGHTGPLVVGYHSDVVRQKAFGAAFQVVMNRLLQRSSAVITGTASDVFVLPSTVRSEAFGLVQLEAMACAKLVVNTAIASGAPFVSVDGLTGFTVPPADPGALASAIAKLLGNRDLRLRFGGAGRHRLHTEFSLDSMIERILALCEDIPPQSWAQSASHRMVLLTLANFPVPLQRLKSGPYSLHPDFQLL